MNGKAARKGDNIVALPLEKSFFPLRDDLEDKRRYKQATDRKLDLLEPYFRYVRLWLRQKFDEHSETVLKETSEGNVRSFVFPAVFDETCETREDCRTRGETGPEERLARMESSRKRGSSAIGWTPPTARRCLKVGPDEWRKPREQRVPRARTSGLTLRWNANFHLAAFLLRRQCSCSSVGSLSVTARTDRKTDCSLEDLVIAFATFFSFFFPSFLCRFL